ncbi:uncharacterized protein LOC123271775 isoform X2 [Cotesia glomerata]|uniref:uncharacterized protein LOC123271775 isoform X2 n=1 Tax=Cotesia glomerata TaxID=32391 RepID=UPI001D02A109|nr:uncharacterized protein LOC123271775 isoform X2 [Cotesia glomerata]
MTSRLKNGRFVKKRETDRDEIPDENGIVTWKVIAKNLKCCSCRSLLDLEKLQNFKTEGLHSHFKIKCDSCETLNMVNTGVKNNAVSEINSSVVLGAIHSGVGNTSLNKILACANLPQMRSQQYKKYESIVGKAIESEARDSCKRAASEERELVIKNVKKLCDTLPPEITKDIFPQLNLLNIHSQNNNNLFDTALGEIINIIVSFDMGWTKRGNGRSYDSLNGYSTIIGFLSGKILDYDTKNRKCRKCDLGHKKEDHDCRLNFHGSAKAMEAAAGVQLVNHSTILKEAGLQVRVIIGDEDSSMIAAVRADNPTKKFHKLSDKNHLAKNFGKELYGMQSKYKELTRKNVIPHLKKCFTYAVSQNKGKSEQLAVNLKQIPDHLFNRHENCGSWCNPNKKHTINLSDETLYDALVNLFKKYASNSHKFSIAASSQANESFNNIVANKAHKNKCLSTTAACDIRVATAVCIKNDGNQSILNIQNKLDIPNGSRTVKYVHDSDIAREKKSTSNKSKTKKIRRIELKQKRELLRKNNEKCEGITYESNYGIDKLTNYVRDSKNCDIKQSNILDEDKTNVVYFDIETTGFAADAHILQIAAICDTVVFNVYVHTKTKISTSASAVTKLHHDHAGNLFYENKQMQTLKISDALESFGQFLEKLSKSKEKCLLVAHNARFDVPRLLRAISNVNASKILDLIVGFADTLAIFRSVLSDRKGPGKFKLESLSQDFLKNSDNEQQSFHDAAYDVLTLQNIVEILNLKNNLFTSFKKCDVYLQELSDANKTKHNLKVLTDLKDIISLNMCKKLAINDISVDYLKQIFKQGGDEAIVQLFTEKVNNKVRVTKKKDIIKNVLDFLKSLPKNSIKKTKKNNLKKERVSKKE